MIVVMMSVTVTIATYSLSDLYLPQIKINAIFSSSESLSCACGL